MYLLAKYPRLWFTKSRSMHSSQLCLQVITLASLRASLLFAGHRTRPRVERIHVEFSGIATFIGPPIRLAHTSKRSKCLRVDRQSMSSTSTPQPGSLCWSLNNRFRTSTMTARWTVLANDETSCRSRLSGRSFPFLNSCVPFLSLESVNWCLSFNLFTDKGPVVAFLSPNSEWRWAQTRWRPDDHGRYRYSGSAQAYGGWCTF